MNHLDRYVEVQLGGGLPQFIPTGTWLAMDLDHRAEYTVIHADLTAEQMQERESQIKMHAAVSGTYADPVRADSGRS